MPNALPPRMVLVATRSSRDRMGLRFGSTNVPGAVPHTSTYALANATLPYLVEIATQGPERAVTTDRALAGGLNTLSGHVVNPAVAEALHLPATPFAQLWGD